MGSRRRLQALLLSEIGRPVPLFRNSRFDQALALLTAVRAVAYIRVRNLRLNRPG